MKLYELTQQAQRLYELLEAEEIDEDVFNDTLEAIGAEETVENYCKIIRQLEADATSFKAEKQRLAERQAQCENGVKRMKLLMLNYLNSTKQTKAKGGIFRVSKSNTKAVNILDETNIPDVFKISQPAKIDKAAIKQAIKSGQAVTGAELITNESVRIR